MMLRYPNLDCAIQGTAAPAAVAAELALLEVPFWGFDNALHAGQVVVHRALAGEVQAIFADLARLRFPLFSVVPAVAFGWDDDASMAANNSSGFNYRVVAGTQRLSQHASGRALDLNPVQNPYHRGDTVQPPGAVRDPTATGTLVEGSDAVQALVGRGWIWGGTWQHAHDWHHFEKPDCV